MTKYLNLSRQEIKKITFDLIRFELSRLRANQNIEAEDDIHKNLDSLEILTLASAVNQFFCLYEVGLEDNLLRFSTLDEWVDVIESSLMHYNQSITFLTSGSTGVPKRCKHHVSHLFSEIRLFANLFYRRKRIVSFVPSHHLYGFLFTILLPKELNIPVVTHTQIKLSELQSGDLIIATPIQWQYIQSSINLFPYDVIGVTSTSPCPPDLIDKLKSQNLEELYEIYGSTETVGIGYRTHYTEYYKLLDHWQKGEQDNEIILCLNPNESEHIESDATQVFRLMNELKWNGDLYFKVGRRIDEAVKIGGINVFLNRVQSVIESHEKVKECAVRSYTIDNIYTRLKAFIVPIPESDLSIDELTLFLSKHLTDAEIPKSITFGQQLPRNEMGKLIDWI